MADDSITRIPQDTDPQLHTNMKQSSNNDKDIVNHPPIHSDRNNTNQYIDIHVYNELKHSYDELLSKYHDIKLQYNKLLSQLQRIHQQVCNKEIIQIED